MRTNFIIDLATDTPRRLTGYRGRTSDGRRGLIVGGQYYKAAIVDVPGIEESLHVGPLVISVSLGNAKGEYTDLFSDPANVGKRITIQRVTFSGTWSEALPPTVSAEPWFEGFIGTPRPSGSRLVLECRADMGRRGSSPRTLSRTLMLNHQPLKQGAKLSITTRVS